MTKQQWNDVADLLEQFSQQCEISFENHDKEARAYLAKELYSQALRAQKKADKKHSSLKD